jgi:hypothetical protein
MQTTWKKRTAVLLNFLAPPICFEKFVCFDSNAKYSKKRSSIPKMSQPNESITLASQRYNKFP